MFLTLIVITITWEVIEFYLASHFPSFPFVGKEEFINKVIGDPISNIAGYYLAKTSINRIRNEQKQNSCLEKTGK